VHKIKKIISVYKQVVFAINKLEKLNHDRPSLIYPLDINELIDDISTPDLLMKLLDKGFLLANENKKLSYEKCTMILFRFERGLFAVESTFDDVINLCCQVSSNVTLLYNDYEKNLNPHAAKKAVFKKEVVTQVYQDIIKALRTIELQVLNKSLIDADSMLQAVKKVEPDINLLFEGIAIVKGQKKFTYYDIVLIMTRFHCGLTRLLYVIRDIQDAIDTLDRAIEKEQELVESQENNNLIGAKK
jgi:hypothetical protein